MLWKTSPYSYEYLKYLYFYGQNNRRCFFPHSQCLVSCKPWDVIMQKIYINNKLYKMSARPRIYIAQAVVIEVKRKLYINR